ncbi:MAG TPA: allophanate hydrolase [Tepidisphaeraceae bacterium]|jgi:allophanate hydrolase|nr:allophanate hydrolase [Tepidisphaeraceae bacterium]
MQNDVLSLDSITTLREQLTRGDVRPRDVVAAVLSRLASSRHEHVWISRATDDALATRADELERLGPSPARALYGIPFAVKDNIDVAGMPTTAACPAFAYTPTEDATVVRRLLDAGAIFVGKTNLDQFATGLVGTRSPHGAPRCVFNSDYVSGGSSSGSAVAVAGGLVSFALGTDTAGSGRVPAAFNSLIGLKPTKGRLSTRGVVPACRSLDCVSIFAGRVPDAAAVLAVAQGFDAEDAFSRAAPAAPASLAAYGETFRFGVPREDQLKFFGDTAARDLYVASLEQLQRIGGQRVTIDYEPFDATARLLYGGAFVAERYAAVGKFISEHPDATHRVVRTIIEGASKFSAADAFEATYQLAALRRQTEPVWDEVDILALPTTGTIYRVDELLADPISLNANLGYYTNFVNLLDLSALAVPAGFRPNGLPFGITFVAPAWHEEPLCTLALRYRTLAGAT